MDYANQSNDATRQILPAGVRSTVLWISAFFFTALIALSIFCWLKPAYRIICQTG